MTSKLKQNRKKENRLRYCFVHRTFKWSHLPLGSFSLFVFFVFLNIHDALCLTFRVKLFSLNNCSFMCNRGTIFLFRFPRFSVGSQYLILVESTIFLLPFASFRPGRTRSCEWPNRKQLYDCSNEVIKLQCRVNIHRLRKTQFLGKFL